MKNTNEISSKNIHENHRDRMRKRVKEYGFDAFNDIELLEFLLYAAVPRYNTNVLAHNLLNKFGSLSNVLDASINELKSVKGVGDIVATHIKSMPAVFRAYYNSKLKDITYLNTPDEIYKCLWTIAMNENVECVFIVFLTQDRKYKGYDIISYGDLNSVALEADRLTKAIALRNQYSVIIAHNHTLASAYPSITDIQTVKQLEVYMQSTGYKCSDYVIISSTDYYLFSQNNLYHVDN